MKLNILTLFPEMFESMKCSVIGKAIEQHKIQLQVMNIRDFSKDKHKKVDDTPYGGGAGMVMKPDVVYDAYSSLQEEGAKVIYLSPKGKTLNCGLSFLRFLNENLKPMAHLKESYLLLYQQSFYNYNLFLHKIG